jgi:hypothetical protein
MTEVRTALELSRTILPVWEKAKDLVGPYGSGDFYYESIEPRYSPLRVETITGKSPERPIIKIVDNLQHHFIINPEDLTKVPYRHEFPVELKDESYKKRYADSLDLDELIAKLSLAQLTELERQRREKFVMAQV